jgi:Flp pilus assembly protein TadB
MGGTLIYALTAILFIGAIGGVAFAFAGEGGASKKRMAVVSRQQAGSTNSRNPVDVAQQKRKNVQALLKDLEKQQASKKQRPTLRKRIEQAGLKIEPRTFWILSATASLFVCSQSNLRSPHYSRASALAWAYRAGCCCSCAIAARRSSPTNSPMRST